MTVDELLSAFDSVNVVRLRSGDVVLFRCAAKLRDSQKDEVAEMLNEVFPAHESIILDGGQDIAVLRPEPGWFGRIFKRAT